MNSVRTFYLFLNFTLLRDSWKKMDVGTAMHLSQAGADFSSTLWHHFYSALSYLRQTWKSVRSSTLILSLLNQSNSYCMLSVAFRN